MEKNQYQRSLRHQRRERTAGRSQKHLELKGVKGYHTCAVFLLCSRVVHRALGEVAFLCSIVALQRTRAAAISLYYAGITIGRIFRRFLSIKLNNKNLIRIGVCVSVVGRHCFFFPTVAYISIAGLLFDWGRICTDLSAMLHETPRRFGIANSQKIIGYQMSCALCRYYFYADASRTSVSLDNLVIYPGVIIGFILLCGLCAQNLPEGRCENEKNDALHRTPETKRNKLMEYWDLFDGSGTPLGRRVRKDDSLKDREYQFAVEIWIVNQEAATSGSKAQPAL